MGRYFSCNGESAISACDPYNFGCKKTASAAAAGDKPQRIRKFTHSELVASTRGFSADSYLGKGSHGSVYLATLDGGRLTAAVKRAKLPAGVNFYENEIEILSRIRGPRLVNLIGICNEHCEPIEERLIVVEYMPNGCLYDHLHRSSRPPGWTDRVRFALQVARAIRGLHETEPPIIHRDIKSSNVLIDSKWNARLGDFGLALRGHVEDVRCRSTPPAGTLGYLDPAYTAPGDISDKSDVFSFGILILEIISGRNAIDVNYSPPSIVDWAIPLIKLHKYRTICDPRIGPPVDPAIMRIMAMLAAQCVRADARRRPGMSEVVNRLQIVRERVRALRVWGGLRRRANPNIDGEETGSQVQVSREVGWSKMDNGNTREVPDAISTSHADFGAAAVSPAGRRVVRSRSVGTAAAIIVRRRQTGHGHVVGGAAAVNNKRSVAVAARLSKSRSVGARAADYYRGRGRGVAVGGDEDEGGVGGGDERCAAGRTCNRSDSEYEEETDNNKLLEKPLVML